MTKPLGETFGPELNTAGLGGLPLAWGATDATITGRDKITAEQNTTLDGVVAAHDHTAKNKNIIPTREFISKFTNAEYRAADASTWRQTAGNAKTWDMVVAAEDHVDMNTQKFQKLKADLVADGILTQTRADEIFDTPI